MGKDLETYGTARSKGTDTGAKLVSLISCLPNGPFDHAVIEKPPKFSYARSSRFGKTLNAEAMGKLHIAIGSLIYFFAFKGISVIEVDVMQWKGKQPKSLTMQNVRHFFGIEVKNDHVSDAIMLGHWWLSKQNIFKRIKT